MSRHERLNPPDLATPSGFSHAVVAGTGRTVYLAGQIAVDHNGTVVGEGFATQFGVALDNVLTALKAAGGGPDDIVAMTVYTTDVAGYRSSLREVGEEWRTRMGRHYPAMALLGVTELVEPAAMVELVAVAVVADRL